MNLVEFCSEVDTELYHIADGTRRNNAAYALLLNKYPLGAHPVEKVSEGAIAHFVRSRQSDGLSAAYINRVLVYLKGRLERACERGLLEEVPRIPLLRTNPTDIDPFSIEELQNLEVVFCEPHPTDWIPPYVRLLWSTGMRPSEAVGLTPLDLNFSDDTISINKSLNRRGKVQLTKSRHGTRRIPVPRQVLVDVHTYRQDENKIFPMQAYRAEHWWEDLLGKAGVSYRPIYHLRHTFATMALMNGASVTEVAGWLGHSSIKHVCEVYSQWTNTSKRRICEKIVEGLK